MTGDVVTKCGEAAADRNVVVSKEFKPDEVTGTRKVVVVADVLLFDVERSKCCWAAAAAAAAALLRAVDER